MSHLGWVSLNDLFRRRFKKNARIYNTPKCATFAAHLTVVEWVSLIFDNEPELWNYWSWIFREPPALYNIIDTPLIYNHDTWGSQTDMY
jgi:hypothetical protein